MSALVSAVIPTRYRPESVVSAVRSALCQTYAELEVIVVIDGPDVATETALKGLDDSRLRVVALAENVGGSEARNIGANAARGEWIGFLDDDDEWLPDKVELQLAMGEGMLGEPIVSCRFHARTRDGEFDWPGRLLREGEPVCEYLLARRGLRRQDGFIATPTILARRSLLRRVPFRTGLRKHQDWDWILRATAEGARVLFCPEVLVKCDMRIKSSVSRSADWRASLAWITENADLVTKRAYASFIMTHVAWQAAAQQEWRACVPLLRDALRNGSPSTIDLFRYFIFWMVPDKFRQFCSASAR